MKYMIAWKIPTASYNAAAEAFLSSGAKPAAGVTTVGRWHAPGSGYGWHLVESTDGTALAATAAEWAGLCELEVTPVIEDAEAAKGISAALGK